MSPSESGLDVGPRVAALGGGLIGRSWVSLFLAAGKDVVVYDPAPGAEPLVRASIDEAWPILRSIGLTIADVPEGELTFSADPREAVEERSVRAGEHPGAGGRSSTRCTPQSRTSFRPTRSSPARLPG